MTLNQRTFRSPQSQMKQFIDRLHRQAGADRQEGLPFTAICDMISIPRDLRAGLREQLVDAVLVVVAGDRVRLTEVGRQFAIAAAPGPDGPPSNPSPQDRESRVRTPGSGTRPRS